MNKLLTKQELATILHVSTRTIDRWRAQGKDVGQVKLGSKTVRFRESTARHMLAKGIKA